MRTCKPKLLFGVEPRKPENGRCRRIYAKCAAGPGGGSVASGRPLGLQCDGQGGHLGCFSLDGAASLAASTPSVRRAARRDRRCSASRAGSRAAGGRCAPPASRQTPPYLRLPSGGSSGRLRCRCSRGGRLTDLEPSGARAAGARDAGGYLRDFKDAFDGLPAVCYCSRGLAGWLDARTIGEDSRSMSACWRARGSACAAPHERPAPPTFFAGASAYSPHLLSRSRSTI